MRIMIIGGGNVGYYLTKSLSAEKHHIMIVEEDRSRCEQVVSDLGSKRIEADRSTVLDRSAIADYISAFSVPERINQSRPVEMLPECGTVLIIDDDPGYVINDTFGGLRLYGMNHKGGRSVPFLAFVLAQIHSDRTE